MRPHPTLPQSARAPRALFVGRDGILLEPRAEPTRCFEDARFRPEVQELLFRAARAGWVVYLIGNQEDVAHGRIADAAWESFESDLSAHLRAHGVTIARHYACAEHPAAKGKHKRDSVFLFPNTGALYHAAQHDGIDLDESWLVSAKVCELAAGWRAGLNVAALDPRGELRAHELKVEPDIVGASAAELLGVVLAIGRASRV